MAYVSVPKDLSKIKSKFAAGLTGSQIVHILAGASLGVPLFFMARGSVGNGPAMLILFACVAPFAFLALYEKDGQPAKRWIFIILRHKIYPQQRIFKTQNFYSKVNFLIPSKKAVKPKEVTFDKKHKTNASNTKTTPSK